MIRTYVSTVNSEYPKILGHGHELDRDKVIKELGDVLWYIAAIASFLHVPLDEIAQRNIDKLAARYPEGFSNERSINREAEV